MKNLSEKFISDWKTNMVVNLMVTTYCDRHCPWCCVKDALKTPRHFEIERLVAEAERVSECDTLILTGGEPTLHPHLGEIIRNIRSVYRGKALVLVSNATNLMKWKDSFHLLDRINLSYYMPKTYPGSESNAAKINAIRPLIPQTTKLVVSGKLHRPKGKGSFKCGLGIHHGMISIMDGRAYPCCISCGLEGAESCSLFEDRWENSLWELSAPCHICICGQPTEGKQVTRPTQG